MAMSGAERQRRYMERHGEAAREAQRARQRRWRAARRVKLVGARCERCGTEDDLLFHHRDPATKLFEISTMRKRTSAEVEREIAKCDVLCRSCHAKHHGLGGREAALLRWAKTDAPRGASG